MRVFKHYLIIIAISLLPLIVLFASPNLLHTHDGLVHLARMAAYYKALLGGQVLPRWASDFNYGYGMPLFNFIYHTPYLLSAVFIFLHFSLVQSFKAVVIISFLLSGITMYSFAKELFEDEKKAFLVTVFYQFAPFRLVEILVRGSFGEMYTYAFLPLVLLWITKLSKKPSLKYIAFGAASTGLLIISHNSISLVFFGIALLFSILFFNKKTYSYATLSLVLGLSLAAFYWVPALLEHKYTLGDLYMRDIFRDHFPPIINFFIPNFFNTQALQTKGISVQFGIFHVFAILGALYLFLKRENITAIEKKVFLFAFVLIGFSLFFMNPLSTVIWERFSLLRQFQFPWRLLSMTSIATSLLSVSFFALPLFKSKWVFYIVLVSVVATTAFYWNPPLGFDKITNEKEFWDYPLTTTYWGETDVIWTTGPAKQYAKQQFETIDGSATFSEVIKQSIRHTATVTALTNSKIVDNTEYFPGWKAYVNGTKVPIEFQNQNWRGLITFPVPKGTTHIEVIFEKSPTQKISEYITIGTIIILSFLLLKSRKLKI